MLMSIKAMKGSIPPPRYFATTMFPLHAESSVKDRPLISRTTLLIGNGAPVLEAMEEECLF